MAIGKTNAGGSSGSGGTLTVTGIAGDIVTVSKDGKTYTRTFNSSGVAVFKGLSTGTWTVTMTNSAGQTATRTVEITADYTLTIAYFSATISITYPAQSTCVVKNSSGTQVASDTNTSAGTKTWTAMVDAAGTYTITATATDGSGKTKSATVSITADGQSASVTLSYELVLFNNGVVSGYAWDSSNADSGYGDAQVSNGLIYLYGYTWDNGLVLKPGWGEIGISSAINLSDYSTLKVRLNKIDGAEGTAKIQVGTTVLGDNTATTTVTLTAGTTTSLDISSITGNKYISLYAQSDTSTYGNIIRAYFDKVWLE
jgi:hypothetical protein|nr:MAG TPA: hypothetical protein [Caudoviricetes sp.]